MSTNREVEDAQHETNHNKEDEEVNHGYCEPQPEYGVSLIENQLYYLNV